jgi:hypothetical protein
MAHPRGDYIPNNDAKFDVWFKFLIQYILPKISGIPPVWPHIPQAAFTTLQDAYAAWSAAYETFIGPHTKVDTEAKNDAKKAAKGVIRPFVNQYLRFPPVTDEDRTAMGIPNHDNTRTPIGKPKTVPVFTIIIKGIRRVTIPFNDEGTTSRAIPYGMNGAVISWKVSNTPITSPKLLDHTELATKSPFILYFDEEDRGKTVYIALQWQNEGGVRGDYSEIECAIIP